MLQLDNLRSFVAYPVRLRLFMHRLTVYATKMQLALQLTDVVEVCRKPVLDNGKNGAETQYLKLWKLERRENQN